MIIKIVGIDPALRNTGLALAEFDTETGSLKYTTIHLLQTENQAGKTVRKSSDDLRCARELSRGIKKFLNDHKPHFVMAEIPTGTQSARGAFSNGVCLGLLAGLGYEIVELSPTEVKMASVGERTASKQDMITWAVAEEPNLPWLYRTSKGKKILKNDNEHLADAVAAINAGVQSVQFLMALRVLSTSTEAKSAMTE